jgi:hypothetical protein
MKYNKGYKDEDIDVTNKNSFVYVKIKSIAKCIYTFDVWIVQSNIIKILHVFLVQLVNTAAKNIYHKTYTIEATSTLLI